MKKTLLFTLATLLLVGCSTNPSVEQVSTLDSLAHDSTERALLKINREIIESMILRNDPSVLLRHAHDDFLVIAPGGVVENLEKAVAGATSFSATNVSISDEQVTVVGKTAIVIGRIEADGEMRPVGQLPPLKFMAVFVQQGSEWKLLARSLTPCFPLAIERGLC